MKYLIIFFLICFCSFIFEVKAQSLIGSNTESIPNQTATITYVLIADDVKGGQMAIDFDENKLSFVNVTSTLDGFRYRTSSNKITLLWITTTASDFENETVISIDFQVKSSVSTGSRIDLPFSASPITSLVRSDNSRVTPSLTAAYIDVISATDIQNLTTLSLYNSLQTATDEANPDDILKILTYRNYDENVVIDKSLTFTSDATSYSQIEINQIKINNGNKLTIAGKMSVSELVHLETTGQIKVNSNTDFALRSTSEKTAMVINESETNTIEGNVIMERYLPTPSTIPNSNNIGFDGKSYRLLSSPFSDATISQFAPFMNLVLNTTYNTASEPAYVRPYPTFFQYDETNAGRKTSQFYGNFISNYKVPTNNSSAFLEVGKGYQANITTSQTLKFNGTLNNGTQTLTITNSGGAEIMALNQDGFNLVGNPFPSPLDWEKVISNSGNSNVSNTIYYDIPTSQYEGTFAYYVAGTGVSINGGTKDIAAGQGFFVQATAPIGTLVFKNENRPTVYQDVRFFKTKQTKNLKEGVVKLSISKDGKKDETAIYFIEGATQNFDWKYDAIKIHKANSNFSTLYSYDNKGKSFAINGLDFFDKNITIPLAINVIEAGVHTISVEEIKYFHSLSELYLYDSLTQTLHDLKQSKEYEFVAEKANNAKRFTLLFKKPANLDFYEMNKLNVYPNPSQEFVSFSIQNRNQGKQVVSLYNTLGFVVYQEVFDKEEAFLEGKIDLKNFPKGIYIMELKSNEQRITKKLIRN
ncbi:T9SS type A sorting domain-containing protein [Bernardetia sp. ABR2-2B]|uniref:T9SS type A sorting domain-containing protein n=1 Tax=Bernardetia sp. ABR2-2B TaxID=3127472 RepID=UPI0030D29F09